MSKGDDRPKTFQLHHVAIQTGDLPKAVRFYRDILGLTPIKEEKSPKGREIVWFDAGGTKIELYGGKPGQELAEGWDQNGVGPLSIGFWVDRLDEAVSLLRSKGVKIHREPYYPVPNERAAMILGPDGEEIVLLEQRIEEDGH
jgi:catechol 2,3-dioxygenase-like lactoylglutathione lyase family enzyme